jgi:hypothetical protein
MIAREGKSAIELARLFNEHRVGGRPKASENQTTGEPLRDSLTWPSGARAPATGKLPAPVFWALTGRTLNSRCPLADISLTGLLVEL